MATPVPISPVDEHELYPIHEEDDVPEIPFHEAQTRYLRDTLSTRFPEWHVTGNVCIYWEPGNTRLYLAPDVFVATGAPLSPRPRVHLTWQDPPILFVAEIGSRSTLREDEGPKLERYAQNIQAPEYLYSDPPKGDLRLWRLTPQGYVPVQPEPNGRLRSQELDLEFGIDESGFLRVYTLAGDRLRTHAELEHEREEAEERAAAEAALRHEAERVRGEAEARAAAEAELRQEAEREREEAEARAAAEAELRDEAERRAAAELEQRQALERRLAELQAELNRRDGGRS